MILGANVENLTLTGPGNFDGTGNTLNNVIIGNDGNNLLTGDNGNDTLDGGGGGDTLKGGLGNDVYFVDLDKDVVVEDAREGKDTVYSTVTFEILNEQEIETLIVSSAGHIEGHGNTIANAITMIGVGDAYLTGSSGNDTLIGGANNDELSGGNENDLLNGGRR